MDKTIFDLSTGETSIVPMTAEEIAAHEYASQKAIEQRELEAAFKTPEQIRIEQLESQLADVQMAFAELFTS